MKFFARFYSEQTGGLQPDTELLRLFGELIGEVDEAEEGGKDETA